MPDVFLHDFIKMSNNPKMGLLKF